MTTRKVRVADATGAVLDWMVAKAADMLGVYQNIGNGTSAIVADLFEGRVVVIVPEKRDYIDFKPSTDWSQGGPIIEKQKIEVRRGNDLYFPKGNERGDYYEPLWLGQAPSGRVFHGSTPLIAAMRCYVASKLGDEVDVPEELVS